MPIDADRLQKPVRKIRKLLKKMPAVPTPEEVHDLRTNSRKVEASFQALSLNSSSSGKRTLKRVSKLRKRAGKVRDMDVLTAYLSGMRPIDGERDCLVELLEYLGAQREKHAKKLSETRQGYEPELRKLLKQSGKSLEKVVPIKRPANSKSTNANADVSASALRLLGELRETARLGKGNLHPYRLKVKELRNLLQMAENSDQQEFVSRLGDVKDAIGEWHDWGELEGIAKRVLGHRNCKLIQQIHKTTDSKYEGALSLTESMRKNFLQQDLKAGKRSRNASREPAEPVWSATAALTA